MNASQADLTVVLASASEPCIHFSRFYEYSRQGENITGRQKCAQHLACRRGDIKKKIISRLGAVPRDVFVLRNEPNRRKGTKRFHLVSSRGASTEDDP